MAHIRRRRSRRSWSGLSLRGRVTLATLAALAAGLVFVSVVVNVLLDQRLSADASRVLRNRAEAQLTTVSAHGPRVTVREARGDDALDQDSWVFARGRVLRRAAAPSDVQRAAAALADVDRATERDVAGRVRLLAHPVRAAHRRQVATVVVGVSLAPYHRSARIALVGTIVLDVLVLGVGALAVRRSVDAALRPVAEMAGRAAAWSEHDLDRRFEMGAARDELTHLAATLDGLLARIGAAVRHEQRLSAEIAHELRTPLSGVRAEAELALRAGGERAALQQVLAGTDRMSAAIDTLLATARTRGAAALGACDPRAAVDLVVSSMRPVADARGVRIEVEQAGGAATVTADEPVVAQALHPLLENAVRHAASTVRVTLAPAGDAALIAVADDGPGVSAEDAERIFLPGVSGAGGAGLGLPLARRLARACGGDVTAVPATAGGRFELRLPRQDPASR